MARRNTKDAEIYRYIPQTIKLFRKASGFRLRDIAENRGVSVQQWQKYESGTNYISIVHLYGFVKLCGITLEEFFNTVGMELKTNMSRGDLLRAMKMVTLKDRAGVEAIQGVIDYVYEKENRSNLLQDKKKCP